jgi:hypothetical protein
VADKAAKYWDYNECAWVKCPTPPGEVRVPEQQHVDGADADDQTVVVAPI